MQDDADAARAYAYYDGKMSAMRSDGWGGY